MQDYQDLISHLRECHKHDPSENTFSSAADAIEELVSRLTPTGFPAIQKSQPADFATPAIAPDGILIEYGDSPIEAACKLATAVRHTKASPVANAVRAALGQDTVEEYINEVFTCDELREIAEHLMTYADHNEELEDML